jgi:alpha-glucosidase
MKYGTPMLRPLVFADQNNPEVHHRNEEFLLGDHLLICPVTKPGQQSRQVYLPSGGWYHNWDDAYFEGTQEIEVASPIKQIPLFIREGAVIPAWPQMQFVGEKVVKEVTLHVYYKEGQEVSWMYMDDGDNMGYKGGQSALVKFEIKGQKNEFRIWQNTMGSFPSDRTEKYKFVITGIPFNCSEFLVDGKSQKIGERNKAMGKIKFTVDKHFHTITIR